MEPKGWSLRGVRHWACASLRRLDLNTSQRVAGRREVTSSSEARGTPDELSRWCVAALDAPSRSGRLRGLGFCLSAEGRVRVAEGRSVGRAASGRPCRPPGRASTNGRLSSSPGLPRLASPFPALLLSRLGRVRVVCGARRGPPGAPHPPPLVCAPGSPSIASLCLPAVCVSDRCFPASVRLGSSSVLLDYMNG